MLIKQGLVDTETFNDIAVLQKFSFIHSFFLFLEKENVPSVWEKVQVGKDQERRNQKKIPTPKTEVGKKPN